MNQPAFRRGFSLIEVMIAIVVLAVAVIGLTSGLNNALISSHDAEEETVAAEFAAGRVEMIRADQFIDDGETEGACGEDLPAYRWRQSIAPAGIDGLHDVKVTMKNARTGEAIYELRTLLFEPPVGSSTNQTAANSDRRRERRKGGRE